VQEIALFLQDCGASPAFAERLFRHYGAGAIGVVREDPYALIEAVRGVGFRTADLIARSLGMENDAPARMAAGLVYTLSRAADDGHTYLPLPQLYGRAQKILEVSLDRLLPILPSLVARESIITEEDRTDGPLRVFLPAFYWAEVGLASGLARLQRAPGRKPLPAARVLQWLDRNRTAGEVELSPQQNEALTLAMTKRVCVITGGPGTGKSTIMRALVRAFETAGRMVLLASPTGRAARRLSEVTGRPATTLHKLLEFDPQRLAFRRDQQDPIRADLLIVDEASMLDVVLANCLVKAVPPGAHLVLIGDTDQLPSVGPGNVLRDLLASETVPVYRLTHVFRQALGSLAVRNAHRVNRGEMPELVHPSRRAGQDCVFLEAANPADAIRLVCQLLRISLPRQGFGPDAVQALAPMNKGSLGILALNEAIQRALNPAGPEKLEVTRAGIVFRVGDRVIQLVNDYDRDVFNGDVGQITQIDLNSSSLTVAFPTVMMENSRSAGEPAASPAFSSPVEEGRLAAETRAPYISIEQGSVPSSSPAPLPHGPTPRTEFPSEPAGITTTRLRSVHYLFTDLDELQLAYAMTVHKAQGSEFPVVILLLHEVHGPMLQRNLFYTGLTRGRKLTILVGMRSAVGQAVARQTQQGRLTGLTDRLRGKDPVER
nr:AAA family ATPase [Armatimonadota bacterium]